MHSFEARQAFVRNIAHGEAGINLADAAFQIAAEDDALVSHSSVKLPVQQYAKRMQRMAEDIARNKLSHMPSVGSDRDPEAVLQVSLSHFSMRPASLSACLPLCHIHRWRARRAVQADMILHIWHACRNVKPQMLQCNAVSLTVLHSSVPPFSSASVIDCNACLPFNQIKRFCVIHKVTV